MHRVLKLTKRCGRGFRKWPHWAKDLYGIISYVNFIELLPTLAAIVLAPRHFFRRLPLVLANRRRVYQTPVKFFFNFASLFLALFYLRHGDLAGVLEQATAAWYMPLLIPATPLFMAGLAVACLSLYQLPRLVPSETPFPHPNPHPLLLVLSPVACWQLDPKRFAWGLFYISVYFVAAWQIAQLVIGLGFLATVALVQQYAEDQFVVRGLILIVALVLVASAVHWLVLRPYAEMFRMSLRRPTRTVFDWDVYELKQEISQFLTRDRRIGISADELAPLAQLLEYQLSLVNRARRIQDLECQLGDGIKQQRAQVYAEAFRRAELRHAVQTAVEVPLELRQRFSALWDSMGVLDHALPAPGQAA